LKFLASDGGAQPRDVLRLALLETARLGRRGIPRIARLARGGPSPRPCCGSPFPRDVLRLALH